MSGDGAVLSRVEVEDAYRQIQRSLVEAFEEFDGSGRFASEAWDRPEGGGGVTRVLSEGKHLEKAAVNFSAVSGDTPAGLSERMAAVGRTFYATGVSVIVHPRNPYAPTFHANLRYFESDDAVSWFGGGADLTPYYFFEEDASHFHRVLADVCSRHPTADYDEWKVACDEYFRLPHRRESRGVGGLFFDHLTDRLDDVWAFQRSLAARIPEAYLPILHRRADGAYGDAEQRWHQLRRARYVEFNLIWDRGTRFGLETGGRTESILASLPPTAAWQYDYEPEPGSAEAELLDLLRGPARTWV
jgi:coproporphyrinogen III oxidase